MEVQFASRFALNQDCQRVASATVLVDQNASPLRMAFKVVKYVSGANTLL